MRRIAVMVLLPFSGIAHGSGPASQPADADSAVRRGLAFLTRDALAWKEQHNCVSCHHAALVICSMQAARQRGFAVDESVLQDLTKWVAGSGDGRTSMS